MVRGPAGGVGGGGGGLVGGPTGGGGGGDCGEGEGGGGGGGGVVATLQGPFGGAGRSAPFATWSGTGWYRYAIYGGTFYLYAKQNKIVKARGP